MKIAYFDCFCGAGGDMIVASLIDAGADLDALRESLSHLDIPGYSISVERVNRRGFPATKFHVTLDTEEHQPDRNLQDIIAILDTAAFPEPVYHRAVSIFERLANAEAKVHGTSIEKVHFHEVGAVDAIVDVTAAVLTQIGRAHV